MSTAYRTLRRRAALLVAIALVAAIYGFARLPVMPALGRAEPAVARGERAPLQLEIRPLIGQKQRRGHHGQMHLARQLPVEKDAGQSLLFRLKVVPTQLRLPNSELEFLIEPAPVAFLPADH